MNEGSARGRRTLKGERRERRLRRAWRTCGLMFTPQARGALPKPLPHSRRHPPLIPETRASSLRPRCRASRRADDLLLAATEMAAREPSMPDRRCDLPFPTPTLHPHPSTRAPSPLPVQPAEESRPRAPLSSIWLEGSASGLNGHLPGNDPVVGVARSRFDEVSRKEEKRRARSLCLIGRGPKPSRL